MPTKEQKAVTPGTFTEEALEAKSKLTDLEVKVLEKVEVMVEDAIEVGKQSREAEIARLRAKLAELTK